MLNNVHGRHRQSGSVDHACNISVKGDVIEIEFGGFHFLWIFLTEVTQLDHIGVPEQSIGIKIDFRVEGEHITSGSGDQRIHFHLGTILIPEKGI